MKRKFIIVLAAVMAVFLCLPLLGKVQAQAGGKGFPLGGFWLGELEAKPLGFNLQRYPVYLAELDRYGVAHPLNKGECVGWIEANPNAVSLVQMAELFLAEQKLEQVFKLPPYPAQHVWTEKVTCYEFERVSTPVKVKEIELEALCVELERVAVKPAASLPTLLSLPLQPSASTSLPQAQWQPLETSQTYPPLYSLPKTGARGFALGWICLLGAAAVAWLVARGRC